MCSHFVSPPSKTYQFVADLYNICIKSGNVFIRFSTNYQSITCVSVMSSKKDIPCGVLMRSQTYQLVHKNSENMLWYRWKCLSLILIKTRKSNTQDFLQSVSILIKVGIFSDICRVFISHLISEHLKAKFTYVCYNFFQI